MDKKVYHYAATISGGMTDGPFKKARQEMVIRKKRIVCKGFLNERYAIIRINRENNHTEYVCKNRKNTTCLLLFDTEHQTGVLIDNHQAGILFSYDEPARHQALYALLF
ncbi:MAG: hypothetical protein LBS04_05090 [Tannerellaceae bacterium]|nr:hypothetical protein [Tannerellaceae bacterium]